MKIHIMYETVLEFENGAFAYNHAPVLEEINVSIKAGEFVGIIGPNGAGKSTLIRLMAGLLPLKSGKLSLCNQALHRYNQKAIARLIGYVPQQMELSFPFSVEEVVAMGRYPHLQGLTHKDRASGAILEKALEWMDLQTLRERPFKQLSGGEKQRAVIASVLAQEANILLLDEPTSALDLKHQQGIYRNLKALSQEQGKTVIIVTHDVNLASQFCPRLLLMHHGRISKDGSPRHVLQFQTLQDVYGVKVYIDINPFTESVYILPYDTQ